MEKPIIIRTEELKQSLYQLVNESQLDIILIHAVVNDLTANVNAAYQQALVTAQQEYTAAPIEDDSDAAIAQD